MKRIILLLILSYCHFFSFAQNEKRANIWYFGEQTGINFNTTPPTALLDGALISGEGSATICDTFGRLLIYTNGEKIWNRNHEIIQGAENNAGLSN